MPGPAWDADDPADGARVAANVRSLVKSIRSTAPDRAVPTLGEVLDWHRSLYAGCSTPCPDYLGHLRGDPSVPELVDDDVGVRPLQPDGLPAKMGVWSGGALVEVEGLLRGVAAALDQLDALVPVGTAPVDPRTFNRSSHSAPRSMASGCASTPSPTATAAWRACGWPSSRFATGSRSSSSSSLAHRTPATPSLPPPPWGGRRTSGATIDQRATSSPPCSRSSSLEPPAAGRTSEAHRHGRPVEER